MKKEKVNPPAHYNLYPIEAVDIAEMVFGTERMKHASSVIAFLYRMRLGLKYEDFYKDIETYPVKLFYNS